jgi:vacuolar-type H+-ATPase subunit I/STV1
MDVIKMLQSKNRCLQKLIDLSDRFLGDSSIHDASAVAQTDFQAKFQERLDAFVRERESILKVLDLYDGKVTEAIEALTPSQRTPELISQVEQVLQEKDRLIQTIIAKDDQLTLRIEARKTKLQEDLLSSRKSRDLAGKFKSTWVNEPGEGLDTTL